MADTDERLRNVEQTLARIEITLENFLRIENRVDELRQEIKERIKKHDELAFLVQQNALVVNALKWVAATIVPILLSVLGTVAISWFKLTGGV